MKAFVIGALLVQTLHAEVSDDFAATPDVTTDEFAATLAPLIIPGPDAPSEAEISSEAAFGAGADATPDAAPSPTADAFDSETTPFADAESLPIGTADVIIDQTSSEDPDAFQATPVSAEFGSGATPDAGVSFNGTGWTWPQAQVNASSEDPDYLNGFAVSTQSSDPSPTQDADAVTSPFGIGFEDPYTSAPYANYTTPTSYGNYSAPTAPPTLYDKFGNPIAPTPETTASPTLYDEFGNPVVPIFGAGASADGGFGGLAASDVYSDPAYDIPASTISDFDSAPLPTDFPPQPLADSTATFPSFNFTGIGASPTFNYNGLGAPPTVVAPQVPGSTGASSGVGAQADPADPDYGAGNRPGGSYSIGDNGDYDGQDYDYGNDDTNDACPWWCLSMLTIATPAMALTTAVMGAGMLPSKMALITRPS
jgi:hypothetical protein